jgi:co-chaperonin GroES (HSP10)
MKPLSNYVLVAELPLENKTDGGIILTTKIDKTTNPGVALAIGPEVKYVKVKDSVALDWSKGLPVSVKGEQAILISEEFIRGVY